MSEDFDKEYNTYYSSNQPEEDSRDSVYRMSGSEIPKDFETTTYYDTEQTIYDTQEIQVHNGKQRRKGLRVVAFLCSALLFGIIAGLSFQGVNWIAATLNNDKNKVISEGAKDILGTDETTEKKNLETTKVTSGGTQFTDVSEVVENTMPSIVSITSTISQTYNFFGQDISEDGQGSGSGIIVGQNDTELLVATNNHVVEGAKEIGVTFIDNEVVTAEIKGTDSAADLAVVAIKLSDIKEETRKAIKVASLGNSDYSKVGQMVIAIGNALGYGQSVTVGYISAKDREVNVSDTTMVLLQTDAAINPGNSGGALININGEVIGINSVKYASSEVEGMGYAIPITRAIPIINELMSREKLKDEEKGYLGITGTDVTEAESSRYNMPIGIYVYDISEDGAAIKAGVQKGDIITKINNAPVDKMTSLQERVNSYRIGTKITITVMRNNGGTYEEMVLEVTLKGRNTLNSLEKKTNKNLTPPENEMNPQDPSFWE